MNYFALPLALLNTTSTVEQMKRAFFDDTFAGIHQLSFFDYAMMVPYFLVLCVLSFYGLHRYAMIRAFYKNRHNLLNSPEVNAKLTHRHGLVRKLAESPLPNDQITDEIYLSTLSRLPTAAERSLMLTAFESAGANRQQAVEDTGVGRDQRHDRA